MSEWEPATDAEIAMRDALRTDDQESYFRILSAVDLLLPVSADALAGLAPLGWGTWSTGGRTHVLAFTSSAALQACLSDYTGSARRVPYAELANTWPNLEWWLAVNPGLPIEGYLPAWFVAQLSRGDLRLPTRGPGRDSSPGPGKVPELHAAAPAPSGSVAHQEGTAGGPGGPTDESAQAAAEPAGYPHYPGNTPAQQPAAARSHAPAQYAGAEHPAPEDAEQARPLGQEQARPVGQERAWPAGQEQAGPGGQERAWPAGPEQARPGGEEQSRSAGTEQPRPVAPRLEQIGPGGLPIRTPSGVMPSGLPARTPAAAVPASGNGAAVPANSGVAAVPAGGNSPAVPTAYRPPSVPISGAGAAVPTSGAAWRGPATDPRGTMPESRASAPETRGPRQDPRGPLPVRTPMAQTPPVPEHITPHNPDETPFDPRWSTAAAVPATPTELPRRHPAPAPASQGQGFPQGLAATPAQPAYTQPAMQAPPLQQAPAAQGFGSPLPRRQATPPSEQSPMTSFPGFQSPQGTTQTPQAAAPSPQAAAQSPQALAQPAAMPHIVAARPPVIPGTPGSDRPARLGAPLDARQPAAAPPQPSPPLPAEPFVPANDVERDLYEAAGGGSTDSFLSTLLLATVLVPVANHSRPGSAPGESGFAFRTEEIDGEQFLVVFTSKDRLAEHYAGPTRTVGVRFLELIRNWPDPSWSFAVNPGTPVGAKYPGPQVIALASWAAEAGLGAEPAEAPLADDLVEPVPVPEPASDDAQHATVMQKTLPPEQVDYYLERGYDRVAGFVHRATEVEHLRTPGELFAALGLSAHQPDAKEAYVLRWPAYRPSLYRIPYGGQNEQALRAMDGWVIERAPFRGNGFAPGEGRDVIAEFKVDSVRLPHGAQLWRIDADGSERMVAIFDNDGPLWRRVGEQ